MAGVSQVPVRDLGNGTYTAALEASKAGLVTVSASINGELIGLPVTIVAVAETLRSLLLATPSPVACVAGEV
jgi:hypothetical protein